MNKAHILNRILEEKIISIVRLKNDEVMYPVIENLIQGGINVLEITSNTPKFNVHIANARKKHPEILIGAGTITNQELAGMAIEAGAQFLVTPNTSKEVLEVARAAAIPVIMGAFTPTEVSNAVSYGADMVKLFPAGQMGVSYYKALKGPFSSVPFVAVGGIGMANLSDWLDAGIDGIGVGSTLIKQETKTTEELDGIASKARQFKDLIKNHGHLAN